MALHHAISGELIALHPADAALAQAVSTALVKTPQVEVLRMVFAAGKTISEHQVAGEMTIQCLLGTVELTAHGRAQLLRADEMVYLAGDQPYAIKAIESAILLVTILLKKA